MDENKNLQFDPHSQSHFKTERQLAEKAKTGRDRRSLRTIFFQQRSRLHYSNHPPPKPRKAHSGLNSNAPQKNKQNNTQFISIAFLYYNQSSKLNRNRELPPLAVRFSSLLHCRSSAIARYKRETKWGASSVSKHC
ncbi:hypothetical protein SDJN02_06750, partial [Cucurbita argyrosperma subsp. argyrosperma]